MKLSQMSIADIRARIVMRQAQIKELEKGVPVILTSYSKEHGAGAAAIEYRKTQIRIRHLMAGIAKMERIINMRGRSLQMIGEIFRSEMRRR